MESFKAALCRFEGSYFNQEETDCAWKKLNKQTLVIFTTEQTK